MDKKVMLGVGVAAAVGGAAAAAFAAYLVLKDENDGTVKSSQGIPHISSRPVTIDVSIPKKHIGYVIGRGGDTIKEIQRRTNTRIHFKDELETDSIRVCTIQGQPDEAQLAEILIHQTIANQPRVENLVLMVPSKAMGAIIGRNGDNIRGMQSYSKCKIEVERSHNDGPKKVTLTGTGEQIAVAKELIDEKLIMVAEREQAREEQRLNNQRRKRHSEGRNSESQTTGAESMNAHANVKTLEELESFGISLKPSLLYLTAEEDPKSHTNDIFEPKYGQEKLQPTCEDKVVEVYVSSISSPSQFYVQKVGPESIALDKLVQEMTAYYEITANQKLNELTEVNPGDLVASQISSDSNWYRARIVDVIVPEDEYDDSQVEVDIDFVDFGDCERKSITSVFKLLNNFLNINFQAIECCLADVIPLSADCDTDSNDANLEEIWSEGAADDFERLTHASHWKVILAKLKGYKNSATGMISDEGYAKSTIQEPKNDQASNLSDITMIPWVELVDANAIEDINIGEELIALGHATYPNVNGKKNQDASNEPRITSKKNSECMDEGISVNDKIEETDAINHFHNVTEDFADKDKVSSSTGVQNQNNREKIKTKDTSTNDSLPMKENDLSTFETLQETPIRIMPNNSTTYQ